MITYLALFNTIKQNKNKNVYFSSPCAGYIVSARLNIPSLRRSFVDNLVDVVFEKDFIPKRKMLEKRVREEEWSVVVLWGWSRGSGLPP